MRTFRAERSALAALWSPSDWLGSSVRRGAIRLRSELLTVSYELDASGRGDWRHFRLPVDAAHLEDPRVTTYRSPSDPDLVLPPVAHRPRGLLLGPLLQHRLGSRFVWRATMEMEPGYRRAIAARLTRRAAPPPVRLGAGDGRVRLPGTLPVSAGTRGHWTLIDWAPGVPLHVMLTATDIPARARIPARLESVGHALAEFHATAGRTVASSGRAVAAERGAAGELQTLATLRRAAGSVFTAEALAAHDAAVAVLAADAALLPSSDPRSIGLLHGDLHDKQILLDGETTHLIDLDGAAPGPVALDIGNLEAHLVLRALQAGRDAASARPQIEALAAGYARSGHSLHAGERAWFRRASLLRLALLYLFRLSPAELPAALLESAVGGGAAMVAA